MLTIKQFLSLLLLTFSMSIMGASLTGCNTTEGFGEDLEEAGEGLQEEAEEHND